MVLRTGVPAPAELDPYRRSDGSYSFPICGDIAKRLCYAFPDIDIDSEILEMFVKIREFQQEVRGIAQMEDTDGDASLYPYQRVAVKWLHKIRRGILADEQGIGKTVMSLCAARLCDPSRALVICSNSKTSDWSSHIGTWLNQESVILSGDPSSRIKKIASSIPWIICNYKIASMHWRDLTGKIDLVIVDEAHKARNKKTDTFSSITKICRRVEDLYLLTATPTINQASDLWTLLNLCDHKRFSSFWGFAFRFCTITNDGYGLKIGQVREEQRQNLKDIMSVYILRRTGMLDLPDPKYRIYEYNMSSEQKRLHDEMLENGDASFRGEKCIALSELAIITRLRQIAIDPSLIFSQYRGLGSKLDELPNLIKERDGKVVVFTHYAEVVDRALTLLGSHGIEAVPFIGAMSTKKRSGTMQRFREGSSQVMVLTFGTGGESLDLFEADRAIFLESHWHPAGNEQALKRILRHGQKSENVEIIFMKTLESIEDHIWDIVHSKREVTIGELMNRIRPH